MPDGIQTLRPRNPILLSINHCTMKKILVPFDFSDQAIEALKFATALVEKEKAEIQLVHSIELPVLTDSSVVLSFEQDYMREQKAVAEKKLSKAAQRWVKSNARVTCDVEFGGTIDTIERSIESSGADLVVMGTHGASGLKEYTIGSNTEKVVRRSPVPVIAVRKAGKTINNIVFPTRPEGDQEEITMQIKNLQNFFKAKLHVLYVNTPALFHRDAEIKPKLEAFAKRYMLKNYTLNIFNDLNEADGIINFTDKLPNAMVAMRTHGRLGITHLAAGSVAEDVVNHIECPIWTLKIK
jgi:nucleotide-binding universal stress UspA family protein